MAAMDGHGHILSSSGAKFLPIFLTSAILNGGPKVYVHDPRSQTSRGEELLKKGGFAAKGAAWNRFGTMGNFCNFFNFFLDF